MEPLPATVEVQSPNHWTTRKFPHWHILDSFFYLLPSPPHYLDYAILSFLQTLMWVKYWASLWLPCILTPIYSSSYFPLKKKILPPIQCHLLRKPFSDSSGPESRLSFPLLGSSVTMNILRSRSIMIVSFTVWFYSQKERSLNTGT